MTTDQNPELYPHEPQGDLPPLSDTDQPQRGNDVSEIELKLIVREGDHGTFTRIRQYLDDRDWIRYRNENAHLITRQLDTQELDLYSQGSTVRMRAQCNDNDLNRTNTPDICVKTGKSRDESGALRRGEYEAEIGSFEQPVFWSLREKYPEAEYPELHNILNTVRAGSLREYFRIDCLRHSYLVELPPEETGLHGKRFVAEVEMDDVLFILDVPGMSQPIVFHYDREIECETRFKPPSHDTRCDPTIRSTPLTEQEVNHCMSLIRDHIIAAAGPENLTINFESKAERGFTSLLQMMKVFQQHLAPNTEPQPPLADRSSLPAAFQRAAEGENANDNNPPSTIAALSQERIAEITQSHAIAVRKAAPFKGPQP